MEYQTPKHSQNLRTFYTLVLTQTFSLLGSRISGLAVSIWVFAETGNATPLALVAFFGALPMVLASGISGVLADRWDRRYVMVLADAGQAVGTLLLLISFASDSFQLWHLYSVAFIQSLFSVFQGPAFGASITMLIPDEQRDRANAIRQLTDPLSGLIAPAIAAVVYSSVGVTGAILVDLITFVVAVLVVFSMHIPRPKQTEEGKALQGSVWKEMVGGMRYLYERKSLFYLTLHISLLNFLASGAGILFTPYVLARTDNNELLLGTLMSVMNAGAIVGGIGIGVWGGTRPRMKTIVPSIIAVGVFIALIGISRHPVALGATLFVMMLPIPVINTLFSSIIQAKVAPDIQGRVFATLGQISMLLMPVSALLAGPLADQVFEPAVGGTGWDVVAPLVGDGTGAGMGLIMVLNGSLIVVTSLVVFALPMIRRMESILPDYAPVAAEETEPGIPELPDEPETAPVPSTD